MMPHDTPTPVQLREDRARTRARLGTLIGDVHTWANDPRTAAEAQLAPALVVALAYLGEHLWSPQPPPAASEQAAVLHLVPWVWQRFAELARDAHRDDLGGWVALILQ